MAKNHSQVTRVTFFTYRPIESALELYRFHSPLKAAGIEIVPGVVDGELRLENIANADLICFQRDFSCHFKAYQNLLAEAGRHQIPFVLDLDDNLLALPPDHPDRLAGDFADSLPALLHALIIADAVTVTTPELKQDLDPFNPNVIVLPNYLDEDLWQFRQPNIRAQGSPVKILFMGTPTHIPDIKGIADPLCNTARHWGSRVHFSFFGATPPEGLSNLAEVDYKPVHSYEYREFQQELRQYEADIAIAPLEDNPFNRGKSAIKFLEYSACGLVGVYAALPPYTAVVRDGENGFLAADAQEWERKLGILIENPDLCVRMVAQAQEDIRSQWLVSNHGQEWREAYNKIASRGIVKARPVSPILEALAATALQLEELRELTYTHSSRLQQDLLLRDQQIEALKDEVVDYANSRSWKLTRPLRSINHFLKHLRKK